MKNDLVTMTVCMRPDLIGTVVYHRYLDTDKNIIGKVTSWRSKHDMFRVKYSDGHKDLMNASDIQYFRLSVMDLSNMIHSSGSRSQTFSWILCNMVQNLDDLIDILPTIYHIFGLECPDDIEKITCSLWKFLGNVESEKVENAIRVLEYVYVGQY